MTTARGDGAAAGSWVMAAGVVLWRGDATAPEVALVHRPRYDDWSFPKGKVEPGEHVLHAVVREVFEETGARAVLGAPLPPREYSLGTEGRKHVDYWTARWVSGELAPNDEVDDVRWLPVAAARRTLTHAGDLQVLDAFTTTPLDSVPIVLLRHAKAKSRSQWTPPDRERPLTARGGEQAQRVAELLASAYSPLTVVSSPWLRCLQTVSPYAALLGTGLAELDVLGEEEYEDDPGLAQEAAAGLIDAATSGRQGLVLCSHGNVMDALVDAALGVDIPGGGPPGAFGLDRSPLAKGEFVVVHRAITDAGPRAIGAERHRP